MNNAITRLWVEPRPPKINVSPWSDRWLAFVICFFTGLEVVFREGLLWPWSVMAVGVATAGLIFFRRTHPFWSLIVAFLLSHTVSFVASLQGLEWVGPYSQILILVMPYALVRWGSGKEAIVGMLFVLSVYGISMWREEMKAPEEFVGGAVFLMFPAALGMSARFQAQAKQRDLEKVRLQERELLARELHDTIAHHVSAIAIQAQAGRAAFTKKPDLALQALNVIEEEAGRSLAEMRAIVAGLRGDDAGERAPQPGIDDLKSLAKRPGQSIPVEIELKGELEKLRPSVEGALYRVAREAITNSNRHARNPSKIRVCLEGNEETVQLLITDDGTSTGRSNQDNGFGLVGLAERVALLGGTLEYGPSAGGWRVEASLPRRGRAL